VPRSVLIINNRGPPFQQNSGHQSQQLGRLSVERACAFSTLSSCKQQRLLLYLDREEKTPTAVGAVAGVVIRATEAAQTVQVHYPAYGSRESREILR
jgi:hypothetical protein